MQGKENGAYYFADTSQIQGVPATMSSIFVKDILTVKDLLRIDILRQYVLTVILCYNYQELLSLSSDEESQDEEVNSIYLICIRFIKELTPDNTMIIDYPDQDIIKLDLPEGYLSPLVSMSLNLEIPDESVGLREKLLIHYILSELNWKENPIFCDVQGEYRLNFVNRHIKPLEEMSEIYSILSKMIVLGFQASIDFGTDDEMSEFGSRYEDYLHPEIVIKIKENQNNIGNLCLYETDLDLMFNKIYLKNRATLVYLTSCLSPKFASENNSYIEFQTGQKRDLREWICSMIYRRFILPYHQTN